MFMRRLWLKYPNLRVFSDGNYDGPLVRRAKNCYDYGREVVVKPEGQTGFSALPRRWVEERRFARLGQWRRLAKDHEQSPRAEEACIQISMLGLRLNRLEQ